MVTMSCWSCFGEFGTKDGSEAKASALVPAVPQLVPQLVPQPCQGAATAPAHTAMGSKLQQEQFIPKTAQSSGAQSLDPAPLAAADTDSMQGKADIPCTNKADTEQPNMQPSTSPQPTRMAITIDNPVTMTPSTDSPATSFDAAMDASTASTARHRKPMVRQSCSFSNLMSHTGSRNSSTTFNQSHASGVFSSMTSMDGNSCKAAASTAASMAWAISGTRPSASSPRSRASPSLQACATVVSLSCNSPLGTRSGSTGANQRSTCSATHMCFNEPPKVRRVKPCHSSINLGQSRPTMKRVLSDVALMQRGSFTDTQSPYNSCGSSIYSSQRSFNNINLAAMPSQPLSSMPPSSGPAYLQRPSSATSGRTSSLHRPFSASSQAHMHQHPEARSKMDALNAHLDSTCGTNPTYAMFPVSIEQ